MKREIIPLAKEKRKIVIERCDGNLKIRPIDEPVLRLRGDVFSYEETADGFTVRAKSDLSVYLFPDSTLEVNVCRGNLTLRAIHAETTIREVHGQISVAHTSGTQVDRALGGVSAKHLAGPLAVGTVNGDLIARHVRELAVKEVHGDARVTHASGDVVMGKVLGDCSFSHINGGVQVAEGMHDVLLSRVNGVVEVVTHGDIKLKHGLPEGKHRLAARQDIVIYWPNHQAVSIAAEANRVTNRFSFDQVEESEGKFLGSLGQGGPHLILEAGAALMVKPLQKSRNKEEDIDLHFEFDFGADIEAFANRMATMGEEIASKVSSRMAEMTSQLEGQFKAMRKKEEAVRRASERMSRYGGPPQTPEPPIPPEPVDVEAVKEARLKVLQILEEGKITVEEADTLLKALD